MVKGDHFVVKAGDRSLSVCYLPPGTGTSLSPSVYMVKMLVHRNLH